MKIKLLLQKIWSKEYIKRFIFCALLIIFAATCLYIVTPKWEYIFIVDNSIENSKNTIAIGNYRRTTFQYHFFRHNKITNSLQRYNFKSQKWEKSNYFQTINNDYYEALVQKEEAKYSPPNK